MSNTFDTLFVLFYDQDVKELLHPRTGVIVKLENKIKIYREEKSLSQGKLADLCNVTRQTINAIENNKYDPSLELAFTLSYILDASIEELFIFSYERNEKK